MDYIRKEKVNSMYVRTQEVIEVETDLPIQSKIPCHNAVLCNTYCWQNHHGC